MKTILFILVSFTGLTATVTGLLMISKPDGSILHLSLSLLDPAPFKNYLLPGILLTTVVGLVNLMAVFLNIQRHPKRYNWALAGGFMISLWMLVQLLLIHAAHWVHFIYLSIGIFIILIAYQLKGKWAV
jgi:hypothetical protein